MYPFILNYADESMAESPHELVHITVRLFIGIKGGFAEKKNNPQVILNIGR